MSQGEDDVERNGEIRPSRSPIDLNTISSLNAEPNNRGSLLKGVAVRYLNDTDQVNEEDEGSAGELDEIAMRN